nr:hypothetical protein P5621_15390 [Bacillus subtilis]
MNGNILVRHAYDANDNGIPKLLINDLNWSSGWLVLLNQKAGLCPRLFLKEKIDSIIVNYYNKIVRTNIYL